MNHHSLIYENDSNIRTRALNALLSGFGGIIGALIIGNCCLDVKFLGTRRIRGFWGLGVVTVLVMGASHPAHRVLCLHLLRRNVDRHVGVAAAIHTCRCEPRHGLDRRVAVCPARGSVVLLLRVGCHLSGAGVLHHGCALKRPVEARPFCRVLQGHPECRLSGEFWNGRCQGSVRSLVSVFATRLMSSCPKTPFLNEHLASWCLLMFSLPLRVLLLTIL